MYLGKIMELGTAQEVIRDPRHPYTRALVSVSPTPEPPQPGLRARRTILAGETPDAAHIPTGCRFHPRCPLAEQAGIWSAAGRRSRRSSTSAAAAPRPAGWPNPGSRCRRWSGGSAARPPSTCRRRSAAAPAAVLARAPGVDLLDHPEVDERHRLADAVHAAQPRRLPWADPGLGPLPVRRRPMPLRGRNDPAPGLFRRRAGMRESRPYRIRRGGAREPEKENH